MSHLLDTASSDADSGLWRSGNAESSFSRCSSSNSLVTNTRQPQKNLESSTSFETGWTDSKHSSYLDFMEANFVQNMFARSYCMEDVCGGTAYHHQCDSRTPFEESDYNTAESRPHLQTLKGEIDNWKEGNGISALEAKACSGIPRNLLANPWFRHFQRRKGPTVGIETNDGMVQEDGQFQKVSTFVINNVDPDHSLSDSLSGSEKKLVDSPGKIGLLKATEMNGFFLSAQINDSVERRASRSKRRILWSTYKQLRRTRQKADSYMEGANTSSCMCKR